MFGIQSFQRRGKLFEFLIRKGIRSHNINFLGYISSRMNIKRKLPLKYNHKGRKALSLQYFYILCFKIKAHLSSCQIPMISAHAERIMALTLFTHSYQNVKP